MMVIYLPVKFEFDWTSRFRVRVRKQKFGQNYTNFERNLAMMVIYLPVKFEFDWTNRFLVRVWKRKCGRTDKRTDRQTDKKGQKRDKRTGGITPISKGT